MSLSECKQPGNAGVTDDVIAQTAERAARWEKRALARLVSWLENGTTAGRRAFSLLYPRAGRAHIVGITGPPGVGKSTLAGCLARAYRKAERRVAVVAVDPSSPFTGGAILGDRIRIQPDTVDDGLFIRSLASRGHLGGLSLAARDVVAVLDACGADVVLLETVGAGQSEVEVMDVAHTTMVVLMPGLGDEVQASKAGILEIGDIFVLNKADHPNVDQAEWELESMLDLNLDWGEWRPPIVKTVANAGQGIEELVAAVDRHRDHLNDSGLLARKRILAAEAALRAGVMERLFAMIQAGTRGGVGAWESALRRVLDREIDPYTVGEQLVEMFFGGLGEGREKPAKDRKGE